MRAHTYVRTYVRMLALIARATPSPNPKRKPYSTPLYPTPLHSIPFPSTPPRSTPHRSTMHTHANFPSHCSSSYGGRLHFKLEYAQSTRAEALAPIFKSNAFSANPPYSYARHPSMGIASSVHLLCRDHHRRHCTHSDTLSLC